MNYRRTAAACLLVLSVCALPGGRAFALRTERLRRVSAASGGAEEREVVSGEAVAAFKAGVSTAAVAAALQPAGMTVLATFGRFGWSVVGLPAGMDVASGLARLRAMPQVEWAQPNGVFRTKRVPDDTYVGRQYALAQVQAFGAWEYETGSSSVTVAFIDTGIDSSHPDLAAKMTGTSRAFDPATGAASNNQPSTPACNHATRASGVAAASSDNAAGVAGMSWGAKLLSLKVFADSDCDSACCSPSHDCTRYGNTCGTSEVAIAAAINDVIPLQSGAAKVVINMSLGDTGSCSPTPLQPAVSAAVSSGLMLFAAAGNDFLGFIDSPANCTGVYAVGATDSQDRLASFSNTDTLMISKGLAAPGVDLYTTDVGGGYTSASGTSFSSPMAAGLAALLWSAKPDKKASDIWDYIRYSADDLGAVGPDREFGWGRINALKALRLANTGSTTYAGTRKAVAYPNPFRPKSQRLITFAVPADMTASGVEVKVYTSEGEMVKKLDGLAWDGRNAAGSDVASGVYLFKIKTDKDYATGKLVLIR
jgi:subtilisin family serine protease